MVKAHCPTTTTTTSATLRTISLIAQLTLVLGIPVPLPVPYPHPHPHPLPQALFSVVSPDTISTSTPVHVHIPSTLISSTASPTTIVADASSSARANANARLSPSSSRSSSSRIVLTAGTGATGATAAATTTTAVAGSSSSSRPRTSAGIDVGEVAQPPSLSMISAPYPRLEFDKEAAASNPDEGTSLGEAGATIPPVSVVYDGDAVTVVIEAGMQLENENEGAKKNRTGKYHTGNSTRADIQAIDGHTYAQTQQQEKAQNSTAQYPPRRQLKLDPNPAPIDSAPKISPQAAEDSEIAEGKSHHRRSPRSSPSPSSSSSTLSPSFPSSSSSSSSSSSFSSSSSLGSGSWSVFAWKSKMASSVSSAHLAARSLDRQEETEKEENKVHCAISPTSGGQAVCWKRTSQAVGEEEEEEWDGAADPALETGIVRRRAKGGGDGGTRRKERGGGGFLG
ncbi:hypothetical protein MMC21_003292 [Puttea exsequens]|nr:hypothetical protein [Puttea exsequens]